MAKDIGEYIEELCCGKCRFRKENLCKENPTDEEFDKHDDWYSCMAYFELQRVHEELITLRDSYLDKIGELESLLEIEPFKTHTKLELSS